MKKYFKQIIGVVLSLVMVAGIIPATSVQAKMIQVDEETSFHNNLIYMDLPENPSTGCTWVFEVPEYLELIKDEFVAPTFDDVPEMMRPVGVGGTRYLEFKGKKAGSFVLTLKYGHEWAIDTEAYDTREYQITLADDGIVTEMYQVDSSITEPESVKFTKKRVNIVLNENPSTGYNWEIKLSNKNLKIVKDMFEAMSWIMVDKNKDTELSADATAQIYPLPSIAGAPVKHHYVLKGVKKGTCVITLKLKRPWESKAIATAKYKVTIAKDGTIKSVKAM